MPSAPRSPRPTPLEDRPQPPAPASADTPTRIHRLLALVRWIITYGQELATSLQQGAEPRRFAAIAFRFQTSDLAAVLARIGRGLLLAGALEARLAQQQAAGRDATPSPVRPASTRHARDTQAETKPRVRHTNIISLPLDRLPSAEAIAAELRRRPIGAVLVDICRDLCIQPGHLAPQRWTDLAEAVIAYGGNMATLLFGSPLDEKTQERARQLLAGQPPDDTSAWFVPVHQQEAPATPTGPPPAQAR